MVLPTKVVSKPTKINVTKVSHVLCPHFLDYSSIHPMAGEGLFAKRYLPKGSLVALFNGVRKREVNGVVSQTSAYKIGTDLFL